MYADFKTIIFFQELEVYNSYIVNQKMFADPVIAKHLKDEEEEIQHGHILGNMPPKFNKVKLIKYFKNLIQLN